MSFSASQKNINEILSRNTVYIIPKNQRKYVWTENEWNELYEDVFLIDQSQNYNHFLGSVVFAKESTSNQYSIIDGQQRLTTLCLLILAISNHLYKLGNEKTPKSFINTFLKGNNNGDEYYKIERKDGPFFLTSLIDDLSQFKEIDTIKSSFDSFFGATDRYNSKLLECFIHFYTKIDNDLNNSQKKNDRLIELKDRIINCEVIEIIVEKDVDGYRVFETLNARGIPLEQHELIKNYLYSYLRTKPKVQKLDNSWAKILENVTSKDIDFFSLFISHYCTHIYGKTKKNEEFKAIRENTPKSNVEGLLTSLVKNSQYYSFFLDPHSLKDTIFYDDKIELSLKYFKDLNIRQVRPLLLSLFEKYEDNNIDLKELVKCVTALETFYFIYSTVLKNTTNIIDNSIVSLSKKIHTSSNTSFYSTIKDELQKYITEGDKARENFRCLGFSNKNKKFKNSSNKRTMNYIFYKFEKYYDSNDELTPKISSIEHVMCDSEDNDICCYIGNLIPLSSKLNNKIANNPFSQKLLRYKTSKLLTVVEFVNEYNAYADWTEEDIKKRGEKLSEIAFDKIWVF